MLRNQNIIIRYMGGLGNQMFQYALRCYFEEKGKLVKDDIQYYQNNPTAMPFRLGTFFPNISLNIAEECEVKSFYERRKSRNILVRFVNKLFPSTCLIQEEKKELNFDSKILKSYSAYIIGYWQSYRYVEKIENLLKKRFEFSVIDNKEINDVLYEIKNSNSVSLHIRLGDYLLPQNNELFGGICTPEYYRNAIKLKQRKVANPRFFVFSNDVNWCKENLLLENVAWVDLSKIYDYNDWMDMYLMSSCDHNIIANSSFSWWAAWLNSNPNKIVVAPKKWMNTIKKDEVCPKDWIRI